MDKLTELTHEFYIDTNVDAVATAVIDFKKNSFEFLELFQDQVRTTNSHVWFDLASLTKPLMNSFVFINEKLKNNDLELLLNHKAGLPAWGLLPRNTWKEQILSYNIHESETEYSDFSALRFMLEVEKLTGKTYSELVNKNLDQDIKFWKDLEGNEVCIQNGYYKGKKNIGKVHDPNAYNLDCYTSHAGLFGTVEGLAKTLIAFNKKHNLMKILETSGNDRFRLGFDTVQNPETTLAGKGCSKSTFGHLGFTGTSFWIDPLQGLGHIILTNMTKEYWFDKSLLNDFRRAFGEEVLNAK